MLAVRLMNPGVGIEGLARSGNQHRPDRVRADWPV